MRTSDLAVSAIAGTSAIIEIPCEGAYLSYRRAAITAALFVVSGAGGIRTLDLVLAKEPLYPLSYRTDSH